MNANLKARACGSRYRGRLRCWDGTGGTGLLEIEVLLGQPREPGLSDLSGLRKFSAPKLEAGYRPGSGATSPVATRLTLNRVEVISSSLRLWRKPSSRFGGLRGTLTTPLSSTRSWSR